ncbi:glycine cleavage system protein GcvH [Macrococcoides canis]|uniref:Glycine cleavage system H protein n=1 Tax=Macrococcoides canis TaxID=1855823 RepID=A0A1W7AAG4_9STAP|nr:glycine cleavage system protein GcvH [Macrococcus canis]ARQ06396.1 Glycine cleavage system H protein [Macrococcus canis]MCO4096570.1 glycine cleavage system protein GcvH [Macrococcus canis]MEE1107427.1 glycine cleavage system protein GcvH [Macrococcus canis]QCT74356.1 glycine cleavage system protein GcvH [Macrococcus canis]QIH75422.1 glycine cleavage system protein GcvH [Macrococcus canis]
MSNLKFSKDHEWVKSEDNVKVIGITDFAQSELGDIVFVELPEVGDEITTGSPFGSVESVKTVSELYAPISGKVVEVNSELEDSPELVNESAMDQAWMIKVEADDSELGDLMDQAQYDEMINA